MRRFLYCILTVVLIGGCNDGSTNLPPIEVNNMTPVNGIRIAWDHSTMKKLAPRGNRNPGYYGYARMIRLQDNSLMCVYETAQGNTELIKSVDAGTSWSDPVIIFKMEDEIAQAVPNIIQLNDGSILVACNPRPRNAPENNEINSDRRFGIKIKKSVNGGDTWSNEELLYEAGTAFGNGCWEPAFLQLPSGEVQLYFANEGPFLSSSEQNISMLRSFDNGDTWTNSPTTISFRSGHRDGMPVPLLLENRSEILVAIEDNGFGEFKPVILREMLSDNWEGDFIDAKDDRRERALEVSLNDNIYAGAPYLAKLNSGEVILSYQCNKDRSNEWNRSCMIVSIGDTTGRNFNRTSIPFDIPDNKSGLWNSLTVTNDNSIIALTSTNAYSAVNGTEVWMVKGKVIPELTAKQTEVKVDGAFNEEAWHHDWPVFIGQKGSSSMKASLAWSDTHFYVAAQIKDDNIYVDSEAFSEDDGIKIFMDPGNLAYDKPGSGVHALTIKANGEVQMYEGDKGEWIVTSAPAELDVVSQDIADGYILEIGIPWETIGGKPDAHSTWRINTSLVEDTNGGNAEYSESISTNDENASYTWCPIVLKQ